MHIIAEIAPAGWYVSLVKLAFLLIVITPWLMLSPWIQKDAKIVRSLPWLWAGIATGAGTIGIILWLILPFYIVGLLIFAVLSLSAAAAYVLFRNGRVDPHLRVMTVSHIKSLVGGKRGPGGAKKKSSVKTATKLKFYAHDGKTIIPPDKAGASTEECEAYNLAQDLLYDVLFHRASEVDAAPAGEDTNIRYVIDGVVSNSKTVPLEDSELIAQYLKKIGGMNVEDRRKPQKGKISVDLANSAVEIEIITAGTTGGQRLQLRVLQEVVQTNIELLGIPKAMLEQIKTLNKSAGLIIVCGKPKSGITSSIYSMLKTQDTFTKQVVTLEAKPSVELENVTQNTYGRPDNLAPTLAASIRRDPDVLMVDQCASADAAAMIADVATQKTVILGMHALDSFSALAKWIKVCENPAKAIPPITAVLCQTLIRRLCPNCKEAYKPDPQMLAKINLSPEKVGNFYRPPSPKPANSDDEEQECPTCQGNGYFGRTGVFELLVMTDDVRNVINAGGTLPQIKSACRKNRMLYLQEQALRKVIEGETSIQEVIRVTQQKPQQ